MKVKTKRAATRMCDLHSGELFRCRESGRAVFMKVVDIESPSDDQLYNAVSTYEGVLLWISPTARVYRVNGTLTVDAR